MAFHGGVAASRPTLAATAGAMVACLKPERVAAVARLRSLVRRGLPLLQLVYAPLPADPPGGLPTASAFGPGFAGLERWLDAIAPLLIDSLSAAPLCSADELAGLARAVVFLWAITLVPGDVLGLGSGEIEVGGAEDKDDLDVSTSTTSALLGMLLTHSQAPVRAAAYQAATEVRAVLGVGASALRDRHCAPVHIALTPTLALDLVLTLGPTPALDLVLTLTPTPALARAHFPALSLALPLTLTLGTRVDVPGAAGRGSPCRCRGGGRVRDRGR